MTNKYKRLEQRERDIIGVMKGQGYSIRSIAMKLHRRASSISREINRNIEGSIYLPSTAQGKATQRRSRAGQRPRLKDPTIRAYVEAKLKEHWSPELIAGRLRKERASLSISHEAIYQWIYTEGKEYIPCLTRNHRKRKWRGYIHNFQPCIIPCRVSIDNRPKVVESRIEVGHWEADTVISIRQRSAALQVITERKTRYTLITRLPNMGAVPMREALVKRLKRLPRFFKRTITYDNGAENVCHIMVNKDLGTDSYFCNPYHSWEKGTVENTIGLIRRFFPKKTDFGSVKPYRIKKMEQWLNHRPRKCLNYQTPYEALKNECCT